MNKKQLKIVTGVAIAVLIVSIIPVFWIGQYLHPFSDDYVFGAEAYKIWNATHSISACIQGAWNVAVNMYHIWQGTYSACFLMALQPGAFGAYWIVPILLASSLIMSTYALLYLIMRKLLHTTRTEFLLVSSVFRSSTCSLFILHTMLSIGITGPCTTPYTSACRYAWHPC